MLALNRLTREFVWWEIVATQDLADSEAEVAYIPDPEDRPTEEDWHEAVIIAPDDPNVGDGKWYVRDLVGPGSDGIDLGDGKTGYGELAPGDYQTWLRITDNPERPVRRPGVLTVE